MGILQAPQQVAGTVGVNPTIKYMISSDNLATVTTAGYLNTIDLAVYPISPSDVIFINYLANSITDAGTFGVFGVTLSNGIITLFPTLVSPGLLGTAAYKAASNNADANLASINTPVTAGHVASFSDAAGTLTDGGVLGTAASKAASNNADANVASVNTPVTATNIASFADTSGTLADGGVLGLAAHKGVSDNSLPNLASVVTGPAPVSGDIPLFRDTMGTLIESGYSLIANINIYPGGSTTLVIADARFTSTCIPFAAIQTSANPVTILQVTPFIGSLVLQFSADPGGSVISYMAFTAVTP